MNPTVDSTFLIKKQTNQITPLIFPSKMVGHWLCPHFMQNVVLFLSMLFKGYFSTHLIDDIGLTFFRQRNSNLVLRKQ